MDAQRELANKHYHESIAVFGAGKTAMHLLDCRMNFALTLQRVGRSRAYELLDHLTKQYGEIIAIVSQPKEEPDESPVDHGD